MKQFSDKIKGPIHFIGIGGAGMAPLAEHCLARQISVQGSDIIPNLSTKRLASRGATIFTSHNPQNLNGVETVVYSTAIKPNNAEFMAAHEANLKIMHRSELLTQLVADYRLVSVAGTHGKTTTTALITHMLYTLGLDPSAATGGRMLNFDSAAKIGKSELFVIEADESDGSLVRYRPTIAVLTNIEEDHLDVHGDLSGLVNLFKTYLENIEVDGCAILGWDNKLIREIADGASYNKLSFGLNIGPDVRLVNYKVIDGSLEMQIVVERDLIKAKLPMIGLHNAQNALCALATARALGANINHAAEALSSFAGVARRLSRVYESPQLKVFDDYAHNPGKIAASLKSLKEAFPQAKINAVFQPHRYSRMRTMFEQFAAAFRNADRVYVLPVYAAGEPEDQKYTTQYIAEAITTSSLVSVQSAETFADCVTQIKNNLGNSDIIVTLGAGDVWQLGAQIKDGLHASQEAKI